MEAVLALRLLLVLVLKQQALVVWLMIFLLPSLHRLYWWLCPCLRRVVGPVL
jgi:hypothetical protein